MPFIDRGWVGEMKLIKMGLALAAVALIALYVLAVLVLEVIMRLLPLIVLGAVIALVVWAYRRRSAVRNPRSALPAPRPYVMSVPAVPVPPAPPALATHAPHRVVLRDGRDDRHDDGYLQLGPSEAERPAVSYVVAAASRSHPRRAGRSRPQGSRP